MKIAIGTDDKETIRQGHFGESRYFWIVELDGYNIVSATYRENPLPEHEIPNKPLRIFQFLNDCDVIIARSMGKRAFSLLASMNKQGVITRHHNLQEAIEDFRKGRYQLFKFFDPTSGKFIEKVNPNFYT